jgi:hypothetical protein
VLNY